MRSAGVPLALALAGCGAVGTGPRDGRLDAAWSGTTKGRMSGTATAVWCNAARIAQVTAIQGDTGLGLLIHATDSLVPGAYPISEPARARAKAPGAALGLRLVTEVAVVGYQAGGGTLTVEEAGGARISGRFDAKASAPAPASGTLSVNGRFLDVPVVPGGAGCPP
jgi:hypothetical protein